jgi:mannitol/fructose-specific phosphotransferase system IIA component
MASAAWDEHLDYIYELERNLKRDPNYERVSRLTSVAVFTAKQLLIAERMINGDGQASSEVRD